jgi:hypothetical protein
MKSLDERLGFLKQKLDNRNPISIMIIGLGSVGTYLLDYILSVSYQLPELKIIVVGRNALKMESDVNIIRIASLIRNQNRSNIQIEPDCDLNNKEKIAHCIAKYQPDFIVNSSRVYSGLKYGTISWHNFRAYGIWSPLAISYIRNIMQAYDDVDANAIVINTSYSDAVNPWLKSAGKAYPDFGSGNLNHLIPRIKFAAAEINDIKDFWNIDVRLAIAHFHDVVISKEGHTENLDPLLKLFYKGEPFEIDTKVLYSRCKIAMPTDSKRNMMNASSNFDIIVSIIDALKNKEKVVFHSPGAFGYIGGYPVYVNGNTNSPKAYIDEDDFSLTDMIAVNRKSIALDGIESIENGVLSYTDILREKVHNVFKVELPKNVPFNKIDEVANFIIERIIKAQG